MCGIFAYLSTDTKANAAEQTLAGLKVLEYRGYDSWGVSYLSPKKTLKVEKNIGKIGTAKLESVESNQMAIGHTRWATHGGVTQKNTHPHLDPTSRVAVVHNGIIENYQALQKEIDPRKLISETDTECVAHLVAQELSGNDLTNAVQNVFEQLQGLNAVVILDAKTSQIVAIKNGSPLAIGKNNDGSLHVLASDATALAGQVTDVYYLEDGEGVVLGLGYAKLFRSNETTSKREYQFQKIEWQSFNLLAEKIDKGSAGSFLEKEILEQPSIVRKVIETGNSHPEITSKIKTAKVVYLVGCGTAYHAALTGSYLLSRFGLQKSQAYTGSEFGSFIPVIKPHDLVIFLSQSGETIDIIESAKKLVEQKIAFISITNRAGSTLQRMSSSVVLLSAGPEISVLATKSFTAKVLALLQLTMDLQATTQASNLPKQMNTTLQAFESQLQSKSRKSIRKIAQKLVKERTIFVIGRDLLYPIALESALKIKEVTYLHTEGIAAGELKHGVIALIEPGTPCFILVSQTTKHLDLATAQELKSRGALVIGIGQVESEDQVFDFQLSFSATHPSDILTHTLVMQLLALEMATHLGRDLDKPRNLAKSVTVK